MMIVQYFKRALMLSCIVLFLQNMIVVDAFCKQGNCFSSKVHSKKERVGFADTIVVGNSEAENIQRQMIGFRIGVRQAKTSFRPRIFDSSTTSFHDDEVYGDVLVESKKAAVLSETKRITEALYKCADRSVDPKDLVAINDLVFKECHRLNDDLQKAKYDIQQIVYESGGIFSEGSGKFIGVKTFKNAEKIRQIAKTFEDKTKEWASCDNDFVRGECGRQKCPENKPYNNQWNSKIYNHGFNKDLFEVVTFCENGEIEKAATIRNWYRGYTTFEEPLFKEWSILSRVINDAFNQLKIQKVHLQQKAEGQIAQNVVKSMESIQHDSKFWDTFESYDPRTIHRLQSYNEILGAENVFFPKVYEVPDNVNMLYRDLGLDCELLASCYGNQFQQVMHAEYIALLRDAATQHYKFDNVEVKEITSTVARCSEVGFTYLDAGFVKEAVLMSNFCWTLLDCGLAVGEGIVLGVENAVYSLTNPVKTVQDFAQAAYTAGYCLYKLLDILILEEDLLYRDQDEYVRRWKHRAERINNVYETIKHIQATTPPRDLIKMGTAIVVQGVIDRKALGVLGTFFKGAKNKAFEFARKVKKAEKAAILTTEGFPVQVRIAKKGAKDFFKSKGKVKGGGKLKSPSQKDSFLSKASEVPDFIKSNKVPHDSETILTRSSEFRKMNKRFRSARIYEKDGYYYYRDDFHTGKVAHLEVFDRRGRHVGEADCLTGIIRPNTIDKTKRLKIK